MLIDEQVVYFVARRWLTTNGILQLTIVNPESGERGDIEGRLLQEQGVTLGDFFRVKDGNLRKAEYLTPKVVDNVAYICNITSKLVNRNGTLFFENKLFSNAICRENLPVGDYNITISLLLEPLELQNGLVFHFEGTEAKPFSTQPVLPRAVMSSQSVASLPSSNENLIVQKGGFQEKAPTKIEGDGFKQEIKPPVKYRAVVLNVVEKHGQRQHFLWILDNRKESVFFSKTHELEKGHFFEGLFQFNNNSKKWMCNTYIKALEKPLLEGGIDDFGRIWFKVKLLKYEGASFNMQFSTANAMYIGEILDVDSKLGNQNGNGKQVKIQRKPTAEKEYVWAIVEVLNR